MNQQADLHGAEAPLALWALARWGEDPFDAACLPADGRLQIHATPPDGRGADLSALCLAPVLPDGFVLATRHEGATRVRVPEEAEATMRRPGVDPAVVHPGEEVELGPRDQLRLTVGAFTLELRHADPLEPPRQRAPVDWTWVRTGAMSGLLHGFTLAAAYVTPPPVDLGVDFSRHPPDHHQVRFEREDPPKKAAKSLPEGLERGPGARLGPAPKARVSGPRRSDREVAENTGLLKALRGLGLSSGAVLGGDLGDGLNEAMSGLKGAASAFTGGLGGLGTRGQKGGGGPSVGIGGLGRPGGGEHGADVDLGARGHRQVRILPGRTVLSSGLDKPDIARVMSRNLKRFRYCYEKELNAKPNLQGKVSVTFTIVPDGRVAKVKIRESTLEDAAVEGCIERVMGSLRFPKPRGGGVVVVTYPFMFVST